MVSKSKNGHQRIDVKIKGMSVKKPLVRSTIKGFSERPVDFLIKTVRPSDFFVTFFVAMIKKVRPIYFITVARAALTKSQSLVMLKWVDYYFDLTPITKVERLKATYGTVLSAQFITAVLIECGCLVVF